MKSKELSARGLAFMVAAQVRLAGLKSEAEDALDQSLARQRAIVSATFPE
jgi:hypothetical protein